jgi:DNA-binding NtrC family response regulator
MERILVVDDSKEARDLAGDCLRDHGMTPVFACNGREAMRAIAEQPPDAILTDLYMPEMDGLELVRLVRSRYSGLPVVLMTSHGSEETAVEALRAGALSYVPKTELRNNLWKSGASANERARCSSTARPASSSVTKWTAPTR